MATRSDVLPSKHATCGKPGPLGIRCEAPVGHDEGPHPTNCYGKVPNDIPEADVLEAAAIAGAGLRRERR